MTESDKKSLRKLLRLDYLEKRIFKTFSYWSDEQRAQISYLIELLIGEIHKFHKERIKALQKQNKPKA